MKNKFRIQKVCKQFLGNLESFSLRNLFPCLTATVFHIPLIKIYLSNYIKHKRNSCIAEQKSIALISLPFKLILLSTYFVIDDF